MDLFIRAIPNILPYRIYYLSIVLISTVFGWGCLADSCCLSSFSAYIYFLYIIVVVVCCLFAFQLIISQVPFLTVQSWFTVVTWTVHRCLVKPGSELKFGAKLQWLLRG